MFVQIFMQKIIIIMLWQIIMQKIIKLTNNHNYAA